MQAKNHDTGEGCKVTDYLSGSKVIRIDWDGEYWESPVLLTGNDWHFDEKAARHLPDDEVNR